MRTLRYSVVDVFTDTPLAGNPLAVFTDARGLDAETMQRLARETNLSETTFVLPREGEGHARVRIFMPQRELPFAGHPTLGTAFVLGGALELPELALELPSQVVRVRLIREGARVAFGWMTQPWPRELPLDSAAAIAAALGVSPHQTFAYDNGPRHAFVELDSKRAVAELAPSFSKLQEATDHGVCAFHVTGLECKMRYFAPAAGVNEDPATGSAAGPLALHLASRGSLPEGEELVIDQGAEIARPSTLYARVVRNGHQRAVEVGGRARVVARGQFTI